MLMIRGSRFAPLSRFFHERNFSLASEDLYARSLGLLIDYLFARENDFAAIEDRGKLFNRFAHDLRFGTVRDGADPAGLWWLPRRLATVRQMLNAVLTVSDWLVANQGGFQYREASRNYVRVSKEFERMDHERRVAVEGNVPFLRHCDLERLSLHLDQRTREVDELAMTWHATYNLIQQSLGILKSAPDFYEVGGQKNALIVVGDESDLDYVLELDERGELEFELLDTICQTSVFFKSIDATVPNLKRMRWFDNILIRSGNDPIFVNMSEDEALAVGNEYARFLYNKLGRTAANQIVSGRKALDTLGVATAKDIVKKLQVLAGVPAVKTMIVDGTSRSQDTTEEHVESISESPAASADVAGLRAVIKSQV